MSKSRQVRKKEHLILALQGSGCSFVEYFSDIILPHDSLTEIDPDTIDLSASLCGYSIQPLYINAITGGALHSEAINRKLAVLAAKHKLPLAVGSQMAGIQSRSLRFTYSVVRKYNPHGIIMANISAAATPKQALSAVEMIDAQILQLHVNAAQEWIMPEGKWSGQGLLANIAEICARLSVPVVVKEVGFGIGAAQVAKLAKAGVRAVDVSGTGGTNFAVIEGRRSKSMWWQPFREWGLPTPICVAEAACKVPQMQILASGGIDNGVKALKCLALGAVCVGTAGAILRKLVRGGMSSADEFLADYLRQMRVGTALMGLKSLEEVRTVPAIICGRLKEYLRMRGIDTDYFRRS